MGDFAYVVVDLIPEQYIVCFFAFCFFSGVSTSLA
jgi:hypothetical protein